MSFSLELFELLFQAGVFYEFLSLQFGFGFALTNINSVPLGEA